MQILKYLILYIELFVKNEIFYSGENKLNLIFRSVNIGGEPLSILKALS